MSRTSKRQTDHEQLKKQKRISTTKATESPCGRKPQTPTSVAVQWFVTEATTTLNYFVGAKWNAVTLDIDGFPTTIDKYAIQAKAVDASGNAILKDSNNKPILFRKTMDAPASGDTEDALYVRLGKADNPSKWRWQVRVRAHAGECWSVWSSWTTAALPTAVASLPSPPAPTFSAISFDTAGQTKAGKIRGLVEFQPVRSWDIPGGDTADDLSRYAVKIQVQEGGSGSWTKHSIHTVEDKDDGEASESIFVPFQKVRRGNKYRVYLRSVDRFNRRGAWAGPYPDSSGQGVSLSGPTGITTVTQKSLAGNPQRIQFDWADVDNEAEFDRYKLEIYYSSTRTGTYTITKTVYPKQSEYRYAVPTSEIGGFFKGIVSVQTEADVNGTRTTSSPSATPSNASAAQDDQTAGTSSVALDDLTDVAITSAATGEVLRYNGSTWVDAAPRPSDLAQEGATSGQYLKWSGTAWVAATLPSSSLPTGTTAGQLLRWNGSAWAVGDNDAVRVTLGNLSNVSISATTNPSYLRWNGTAWADATPATVGGDINIGQLKNVSISGAVNNDTLLWDGTNWRNGGSFSPNRWGSAGYLRQYLSSGLGGAGTYTVDIWYGTVGTTSGMYLRIKGGSMSGYRYIRFTSSG